MKKLIAVALLTLATTSAFAISCSNCSSNGDKVCVVVNGRVYCN